VLIFFQIYSPLPGVLPYFSPLFIFRFNMEQRKDVDQLLSGAGQTKQELLQRFADTFTAHTLYKKERRDGEGFVHVKVLEGADNLINNGYFLSKATLETLTNAITDADKGGVWVNFAVGETNGRGDEIQLVLTAVNSNDELAADDLGNYCATTAQIGLPTDPPLTGDPSPRT
jgi:hypothetical protein